MEVASIGYLPRPSPPPKKKRLHNHCFQFLMGIIVYTQPDLLARFCKVNFSNAKKFDLIFFPRLINLTVTHLELNSFFWRSEFIILSRAQCTDHARIARQLRFRFGHKSFYRFGIHSCLATSHKQMLKTPLNMTWSCILGFQATRPATWAHFIHPLFIVRLRIVEYFCGK